MTPRRLARAAAAAVALILILAPSARPGQSEDDEQVAALEQARASVVLVRATYDLERGPLPLRPDQATFANLGFFVDERGSVLTSLLAVAGCRRIVVLDGQGREAPAEVEAVDQACGLALLSTELEQTRPLPLRLEPPAAGAVIFLTGARIVGGRVVPSLKAGTVSYRPDPLKWEGTEWKDLMVTTAHAAAGCATAPLLDPEGRLTGVVFGVQAAPGRPAGQGSCAALPVDQLRPALEDLQGGRSRRLGWLGLSILREPGDREGVTVAAILEGSPADGAGIRPGDVLLQMDDEPVEGPAVFARRVSQAPPGTPMAIRLLRGSRIETVTATLGARPLLMYGGHRRSEDQLLPPLPPGAPLGAPSFGPPTSLRPLLEENRLLRRRIQELEESRRRLEERVRELEPDGEEE